MTTATRGDQSLSLTGEVTLHKELARSIRQGHPWIYRDAVSGPDLPDGALVQVRSKTGDALAWGFWDARSAIAVRVLGLGLPPAGKDPHEPHARSGLPPGDLIEQRSGNALAMRLGRLDRTRTNAFRWVHGEADRLPGIHVDLYDDVAVVRYDGDGARAFYAAGGGLEPRLMAAAAPSKVPLARVLDRDRRGDHGDLRVRENGLVFGVALGRGGKGGLFLDQRDNRAAVGAISRGMSVLNLFGYTGAFSVYAAAGGALRTDTVDVAAPAIQAARENFALNGLDATTSGFHAADAFEFLTEAAAAGRRWDVVISDPPSFAPNHRALPAARNAYRKLHRMAATVVAPGGLFCPASCSSHFAREDFVTSIETGVREAGRRMRLDSLTGAAFDHPVLPAFPEGDYLKFAMVRMDPS